MLLNIFRRYNHRIRQTLNKWTLQRKKVPIATSMKHIVRKLIVHLTPTSNRKMQIILILLFIVSHSENCSQTPPTCSNDYSLDQGKNSCSKRLEWAVFYKSSVTSKKGEIPKRLFQENKACQIFQKTVISYPLIRITDKGSLDRKLEHCLRRCFSLSETYSE